MKAIDILKNKNLSNLEKIRLLRILDVLNSIGNLREEELSILEDNIYTFDNRILDDYERINVEILKINEFCADKNFDSNLDLKKYMSILGKLTETKDLLLANIEVIKEIITLIEASLDLDISFFTAAKRLYNNNGNVDLNNTVKKLSLDKKGDRNVWKSN